MGIPVDVPFGGGQVEVVDAGAGYESSWVPMEHEWDLLLGDR